MGPVPSLRRALPQPGSSQLPGVKLAPKAQLQAALGGKQLQAQDDFNSQQLKVRKISASKIHLLL